MNGQRTVVVALAALASVALAACGSSSPTTSGGAGATTTTAAGTTAASGLCADIASFSKQEQGLVTAEQSAGGASGSITALRGYAKQSKAAFDNVAPKISADLATAPASVQSAWSSLQPQVDQLFEAATSATNLSGFARAANSIEATNSFANANETLSMFARSACPTTSG